MGPVILEPLALTSCRFRLRARLLDDMLAWNSWLVDN